MFLACVVTIVQQWLLVLARYCVQKIANKLFVLFCGCDYGPYFSHFMLIAVYCVVFNVICPFFRFFSIVFFLPPLFIKRRLLTFNEYEEEGRIETSKALKQLQIYCRSNPEFWEDKLGKLTNQPRFATACLFCINL